MQYKPTLEVANLLYISHEMQSRGRHGEDDFMLEEYRHIQSLLFAVNQLSNCYRFIN